MSEALRQSLYAIILRSNGRVIDIDYDMIKNKVKIKVRKGTDLEQLNKEIASLKIMEQYSLNFVEE